ncbi:MAG: bifunctional precorrin-2 dehydrogenase/sirohydrochlorin ferrochelatase [Planctomycetes bacterium]|nr:bifunctional precorrin-2 dehydrogenase/sirohydrochlorin ferrochelatase [Planctomycetota bacterium]
MPEMYPVFLKLEGRDVLVVGAGKVAWRKAQALQRAGARLRCVAPDVCDEIRAVPDIHIIQRAWRPDDCEGAFMVVAATGDAQLNAEIREAAHATGALVNAVDDPPNCDFYVPAIARIGDLMVAVSTQGKAPLVAGRVRAHLEKLLPRELEQVINTIATEREKLLASEPDEATRLLKLREVLKAELARYQIDLHD